MADTTQAVAVYNRKKSMLCRLAPMLPLLGLLAACASPGMHAPQGKILEPTQLLNSPSAPAAAGEWPSEAWWQRYGDPQLDRLITTALTESPTLALARARIELARAQAGLTAAADGLQVSANVEGAQQRLSEHYIFPPGVGGSYTSLNRAALDFSLELDFWGRNRALLEAALGRARAAEAEAAGARLLLASAVTNSYLQLDHLHHLHAIAAATIAQREKLEELVRLRQKAGLDSDAEAQQAAGSLAAARAEARAIDTQLALVRHQLAALCGTGPELALRLIPPALHEASTTLPAILPADLLGRRPDVTAQRWRVDAARHDSTAARADFYPNINLQAFIGLQSLGLDKLLESGSRVLGVGPALHLPVFDSGRLRAQLVSRHADQDAAVAQYNITLLDALRDVADQLALVRGVSAEERDQQAALARYEEAWRLTRLRYQAGLGPYTAVLAAESPLLAQRRLAADLRTRRLQASAGLARALGGGYGSPENAEPLQVFLPPTGGGRGVAQPWGRSENSLSPSAEGTKP